jgi:glycosyltransferase involved in cell wall biosynthesis
MSDQPKVSVIVPSYNRGEFIEATLVSIQNQSFKDFEVVFVDDGSTDNTAEIVQKFVDTDPRFRYLKQENSERAVARSYGLSQAKADLLCLVDSDDLWYPHKLEKQLKVMEANPDVVLSYAAVNRIDMQGNPVASSARQHQGFSGYIFYDLLMRNFIPSVCPMFRKSAFEKVGPQVTEFIPYEDWDFWLKFSRQGKFFHIKEPLGDYRLHPGQSVQNVKAAHIEKVTTMVLDNNTKKENIEINNYKNMSFDNRDFEDIRNEAYSLANLRFAYWYIVADDLDTAALKLNRSKELSSKRSTDYRWYGLQIARMLKPVFGDFITKFLGSFH